MLSNILLKPSTIQWCESTYAYQHSNYIAEFYNTLTGIALCFTSILYYYNNKNNKHINKLYNSLILLFFIGIATILFHSTLLYIFQIADEIPILLLIFEYHGILSELINNKRKYTLKSIYSLCGFICILGFFNNFLQIVIFQSIFSYLVVMIMTKVNILENFIKYYMYRLSIKKENLEEAFLYHYSVQADLINLKIHTYNIKLLKHKIQLYKRIGLYILITSIVLWYIDRNYCHYMYYINGHACWHILTSIGLYYLNHIILYYYNINYIFCCLQL
jgi:dihydroceramidase